jgi:hypothetical protein
MMAKLGMIEFLWRKRCYPIVSNAELCVNQHGHAFAAGLPRASLAIEISCKLGLNLTDGNLCEL